MEEERVEGAEGAAVVGEPEKCNTVTFVGADGMEQSFPLDFLLERGAIVANRVNGEDIMSYQSAVGAGAAGQVLRARHPRDPLH